MFPIRGVYEVAIRIKDLSNYGRLSTARTRELTHHDRNRQRNA
jgi:hypothetical protein